MPRFWIHHRAAHKSTASASRALGNQSYHLDIAPTKVPLPSRTQIPTPNFKSSAKIAASQLHFKPPGASSKWTKESSCGGQFRRQEEVSVFLVAVALRLSVYYSICSHY